LLGTQGVCHMAEGPMTVAGCLLSVPSYPDCFASDWQLVTGNSPSHVFEELFDLVDELRHSLWVEVVVCRLCGELFDVFGQIG